eukprot:GABV01002254.1.p1 GENE.GABV01002254.1~~GABV01002254.1.p1  ORF type:complete len:184 (-),score=68.52 GABV01002254.1:56-607(-)
MDRTVRLWDLSTGKIVHELREHTHPVVDLEFSNANADRYLSFFTDEKNEATSEFDIDAAVQQAISAAATSGDPNQPQGGQFLLSASRDKTVCVWHVRTGKLIMQLTGHENWINRATFHPSGRYIITAADDFSIRVWDLLKRGRCILTIENAHDQFVSALDFNPLTPILATGSVDHTIRIWDCV